MQILDTFQVFGLTHDVNERLDVILHQNIDQPRNLSSDDGMKTESRGGSELRDNIYLLLNVLAYSLFDSLCPSQRLDGFFDVADDTELGRWKVAGAHDGGSCYRGLLGNDAG
jgi:hypothetical protein